MASNTIIMLTTTKLIYLEISPKLYIYMSKYLLISIYISTRHPNFISPKPYSWFSSPSLLFQGLLISMIDKSIILIPQTNILSVILACFLCLTPHIQSMKKRFVSTIKLSYSILSLLITFNLPSWFKPPLSLTWIVAMTL